MITFKQFLEESRSAPLYHGTGFRLGTDILSDKQFKPETIQMASKLLKDSKKDRFRNGLSTTRSFKFAQEWALENNPILKDYVIFEFDQLALNTRFEIKPLQYFPIQHLNGARKKKGNEFEEFIITNKNIPIKYVTKVHYYIDMNPPYTHTAERARDIINDKVDELIRLRKANPHIKFIPIRGGEVLD